MLFRSVKKGKTLLFHWRGSYLTRAVLEEMLAIFREEAENRQKHASVSINWSQAVLLVSFRDELPEQQVRMEEANEGEKEQDTV